MTALKTLLVLAFCGLPVYSQGWTDLGPNTILKGAAFKVGLYGALVDCPHAGAPYCASPSNTFSFAGLEQYVFAAQSGCATDTVHNHMNCTGGGHTDYQGNQVYDMDIAAKTITRLTDPSQMILGLQINADGTATSTHSQQALVYMPNEDCAFKWGIGVGITALVQKYGWWVCNLRTAPTWTAKTALPGQFPFLVSSGGTGCTNGVQTGSFSNGGGSGSTFSVYVSGGGPSGYASLTAGGSGYSSLPTAGTITTCTGTTTFSGGQNIIAGAVNDGGGDGGDNCFLDTSFATERVLCIPLSYYQLWAYTPSLDTGPGSSPSPWASLNAVNSTEITSDATCRVQGTTKIAFCVGAKESGFGFSSGIYSIDLTSFVTTNITNSTTGCAALYSVTAPGFAYDTTTGMFVGYVGTGNDITIFDPVALTCTTQTYTGGPTSPAYPDPSGTYDRFAYFPSLNKFVVANNATTDMFSLDLTPPTGYIP